MSRAALITLVMYLPFIVILAVVLGLIIALIVISRRTKRRTKMYPEYLTKKSDDGENN